MCQRNVAIDVAKGITIFLMVLGHSSIPKSLSDWIYSFHMPFFFIVSGLLTHWDKENVKTFIAHKTKSLMIPFGIYSIINMFLIPLYAIDDSWVDAMLSVFFRGWGGLALWFVPVLYFSLLITKCIRGKVEWVLILCILLLGSFFNKWHIGFPWNLSSIPIATFFVFIGDKTKRLLPIFASPNLNYKSIVICLSMLIMGGVISQVHRTDLAFNQICPLYLTIPGAFLGTLFMFYLSSFIVLKVGALAKLLSFIGKHTFIILAFSQSLIMIMNIYFPALNFIAKYLLLSLLILLLIIAENKIKSRYHATHFLNSYSA